MKSYKDITNEELLFIKENYRALTFKELGDALSITAQEVQHIIATWREAVPRVQFKHTRFEEHSEAWKNDVAEYYKTHSLSQTSLYFFTRTDFIRQVLMEHNISEHDRAESLNLTRVEHYGSHEAYVAAMVENTKKTSQERYGVDNYAKTKESKDKQVTRFIENYGVDNPMKCDEVKQTYMDNMLERRGVCWPQQDPEILQKRLDTNERLYGGTAHKFGRSNGKGRNKTC